MRSRPAEVGGLGFGEGTDEGIATGVAHRARQWFGGNVIPLAAVVDIDLDLDVFVEGAEFFGEEVFDFLGGHAGDVDAVEEIEVEGCVGATCSFTLLTSGASGAWMVTTSGGGTA